jgi:hypothetical protein
VRVRAHTMVVRVETVVCANASDAVFRVVDRLPPSTTGKALDRKKAFWGLLTRKIILKNFAGR